MRRWKIMTGTPMKVSLIGMPYVILALLLSLTGCPGQAVQKGEIYDILQDYRYTKGINVVKRSMAVWRSRHAAHEGQFLIDTEVARRNPDTLLPYLACAVPHLTWASPMPSESWWGDLQDAFKTTGMIRVVIVEGESAGCQGYVDAHLWRART